MIGVWPNLDELQRRLDETEGLANRRTELLRERVRKGETSERLVTLLTFDIVLRNLEARADSYRVDIARMKEHELGRLDRGSWTCACGAFGRRSTPAQAARQHGEHVMEAVWGG